MLIFLLFVAIGLIELALLLVCFRWAERRQNIRSATIEKGSGPS